MKKAMLVLLAVCAFAGASFAASKEANETKSILKKHVEAAKQDLNAQSEARKEARKQEYQKKQDELKMKNPAYKKKKELIEKKESELSLIDTQIKAKKDEIAAIKKMRISQTEQERRLRPLNAQLNALEAKRTRTSDFYQKQIDFLK